MPFVLVGLGDMAYAVLMFCISASIGTLIGWVEKYVPNPSILGYHPLGFVDGALNDARSYVVGVADNAVDRLKGLFADLAYLVTSIDSRIIHALTNAFTHIAYLYNTTIPAHTNTAENYAFDLTQGVYAALGTAETTINNGIQGVRNNLSSFEGATNTAIHSTIPGEISSARSSAVSTSEGYTDTKVQNLDNTLQNQLTNVWNAIAPLQVAVNQTIPREIAQQAQAEQTALQQGLQQVYANLSTVQQNLQNNINNLSATLVQDINADIAQVQQHITSLGTTLTNDLSAAVSNLQTTIANTATQTINQARTDIKAASVVLQRQITALQRTTAVVLPSVLDNVPAETIAVPVAVGALASALASVITEVDTCAVTTCEGPNSLGNALQSLLGGISLAAELSFLVQAIKDPSTVAGELDQLATGLFSAGQSTFDALLSL